MRALLGILDVDNASPHDSPLPPPPTTKFLTSRSLLHPGLFLTPPRAFTSRGAMSVQSAEARIL